MTQALDPVTDENQPEVLFVCVHNAGRSQMAAGPPQAALGRPRQRPLGGLRAPATRSIRAALLAHSSEVGVDMSEAFPKPLSDEAVRAADVVITMGCGDACPIFPGQEVRGLGPRRSGRSYPRHRAPNSRRDRRARPETDRRAAPRDRLNTARRLAAELIGTFALVFAGAGAIMVDSKTGQLGHIGVALTFGLVIMVMIYAVGHISGRPSQPAVSLAFAVSRHFPWSRVVAYWAAQAAGALPRGGPAPRLARGHRVPRRDAPGRLGTGSRSCGRSS